MMRNKASEALVQREEGSKKGLGYLKQNSLNIFLFLLSSSTLLLHDVEPVEKTIRNVLNDRLYSEVKAVNSENNALILLEKHTEKPSFIFKDYNSNRFITQEGEKENRMDNEIIAFHMDKDLVPETSRISYAGRVGICQQFKTNIGTSEDFGPSKFNLHDIQRIGILDIRILNKDRHVGNILVDENYRLTPIDHELGFPKTYEELEGVNFDWLFWKQSREPFTRENLEFIENISLENHIKLLVSHNKTFQQILFSVLSTMLLKMGAKRGLTLYDIGSMIQREGDFTKASRFEKLYVKTLNGFNFREELSMAENSKNFIRLFEGNAESIFVKKHLM